MPFGKLSILYILTAIVFLVIDLIWLGWLANGLYDRELGHLKRATVNWPAALLFYAIFVGGILFFCILPAHAAQSTSQALLLGAAFGLITYCTYDLTNLATLKDWPVRIVWIDISWGVVLNTLVSFFGYHLARWIHPI
jgi:uncharacterized membrane protein